jgi:putative oxidoreductase
LRDDLIDLNGADCFNHPLQAIQRIDRDHYQEDARMLYGISKIDGLLRSTGMLLLRIVTGAAFLFHGMPKIQNPTGWMGPDADMPGALQAVAAIAEFAGGIALIIGLLTRVFAFLLAATMIVAILQHHIPAGDPFVGKPGTGSWELAAVYLATTTTIMLLGAGLFSLDAFMFRRWNRWNRPGV